MDFTTMQPESSLRRPVIDETAEPALWPNGVPFTRSRIEQASDWTMDSD